MTTVTASPLGEDDLARRFARLTFLNILSNVTVPLASLVDIALLGRLPDIRFLAGVALAAVIFEYLYWSFGFLRMGTTGTTAQALGRGDMEEVFLTLYRALTLAFAIGLVLLLASRALREVGFALLSGAPDVEAAGREYFDARIWAAPATLANFAWLGWFLGRGESGKALALTLVANLANIACNYVLIVHLGLAAFGAGLGTAISQYLMLATAFALAPRVAARPPWRWSRILSRARWASLVQLNRDILVRTVALVTALALFLNLSAVLGTVTLAANAVLARYQTLAAYLIDGAAFATESVAGVCRGRGDTRSLGRLLRLAQGAGLAFTLPFALLLMLAPRSLARLLTTHPETIETAVLYAPWLIPTLLFGSVAYVYDGLYLGLTAGRELRNAALLSTLGVFVPLAWMAVRAGSNHLLWMSMVAFMAARAATLHRGRQAQLSSLSPAGEPGAGGR